MLIARIVFLVTVGVAAFADLQQNAHARTISAKQNTAGHAASIDASIRRIADHYSARTLDDAPDASPAIAACCVE